jgi:putative mRNA 3-end processing factor
MRFNPPESSLAIGGRTLGLDSDGDVAFVSHAHSDHTSFLRKRHTVLASEATLDLIVARGGRRHEPAEVKFDGAKISLHEAGHVLGARQVAAEFDGRKFVYTGDFNASASLTCPAAEAVACDELLVECTFGSPEWVFDDRFKQYAEIADWVKRQKEQGNAVLFGCYSLGKAQEIVAVLNEYLGEAPVVSGTVESVCNVYKRHGVKLDFVSGTSAEAERAYNGAFTAIVPSGSLSFETTLAISERYRRPVRTAIATGWALRNSFAGVDAAFPLSDHSDYNALKKFVEATGARKVWCTYGFAEEFAAELRREGVDAFAVSEESMQKQLVEYAGDGVV